MEVFEKSQTVDPEVRAYVYSLVSAIGGSSAADDGRYVLGDDALACLKDLKRWLKSYDNNLNRVDVKRVLSEANLVKGDLLEILGQWREHDTANVLRRKISLGSLELLTDLTWPIIVDLEKTTVNLARHLPVLQLAQVEYKRAILHHESAAILRKAIAVAVPALTTPRRERNPRDEGTINLVLYLYRNIAMISQPPNLPSNGDEEEISRSETIRVMHEQDVLQLLLTICSGLGEEFDEQDVVVLELLFHLLKGVDPKKLFKDDQQFVKDEALDLKRLLQAEKAMLASHARNAPSRHNRFGTMIWVKQSDEKMATMTGQDLIGSKQKTFEKMDSTKKWNRPRHQARTGGAPGDCLDYAHVQLDGRARNYLKSFVSDLLDSGFNPLFEHLRRAIEREAPRVKEDHARYYFYLISWFLQASEARRQETKAAQTADSESTFPYIASVLTQEVFALLGRTLQRNLDEKSWNDVHACLLAFTQIMLTVSAMSESPSEDDQDIAENMQNRLFYEEATHDRILQVLRGYQVGRQDFPYLDACTELGHVFIRLLERYSKVNVDMYVRSKRRARKKAEQKPKGAATIEGLEDDEASANPQPEDDEHQDEAEARRQVSERKFDFTKFAARFVNEASINTYVALLARYRELNDEQLKRCHRFFYRVAFKMELPILLFRVDILNLLNRLIKGPNGLDSVFDQQRAQMKEWEELVRQVMRKCIKKLEERPELFVEMLFTKIPGTLYYLEHGYDKEIPVSAPRPPAELEVKAGMDHVQQIGVAVSVLVNQGKLDALVWVKSTLMSGIDERRSWEDLQSALEQNKTDKAVPSDSLFGQNAKEAQDDAGATSEADKEHPAPPPISIAPDTDERRVSLFKDKHLRLLLKTLSWARAGADTDPKASWTIPPHLTSSILEEDLDTIRKSEFEPPVYEDSKGAESFIQNAKTARRSAYEKETGSDEEDEGDSDVDESLFVPGGPTVRPGDERAEKPKKNRRLKRKRETDDEETRARAEARRAREKEKDRKIKSTLFVTESDDEDDDEKTQEFFTKEEKRRGTNKEEVKSVLMERGDKRKRVDGNGHEDRKKKAKKGTGLAALFDVDDVDDEDEEMRDEVVVVSSRENSPDLSSEEEDEDEPEEESDNGDDDADVDARQTSLSSQAQQGGRAEVKDASGVLAEVSGNRLPSAANGQGTEDDEDEDEAVIAKPGRRGRRSLFVVDDDEDD